jgi:hypothetical protein
MKEKICENHDNLCYLRAKKIREQLPINSVLGEIRCMNFLRINLLLQFCVA